MGTIIQVLIVVCTIICFSSTTSDAAIGTATFYKPPYVPSACNGYADDGVFIAAASDTLWKNRAACGKNYIVECIGGTNQAPQPCYEINAVVVKIVDYCPSTECETINLSESAFSVIANLNAGRIKVNYTETVV